VDRVDRVDGGITGEGEALAHIPAGQTATIRFVFRVNNVAEAGLDLKISDGDDSRTHRFHFVHAHETKPF